jgi:hypothetical protein
MLILQVVIFGIGPIGGNSCFGEEVLTFGVRYQRLQILPANCPKRVLQDHALGNL